MCRLAIYVGPPLLVSHLVTEPSHSIVQQSVQAYEHVVQLNGDGFGISWYAPTSTQPAVFKEITPAWSNQNLRELARVTTSKCILAHVRKACEFAPVVATNCHPFSHKKFAFMHNGYVANFAIVKKRIITLLSDKAFQQIKGTTDSEYLFALFLDKYEARKKNTNAAQGGCGRKLHNMSKAICDVIQVVEEVTTGKDAPKGDDVLSHLNLVVTDGNNVVATRFTTGPPDEAHTLWYTTGAKYHLHDESGKAHIERKSSPHANHETEEEKEHENMFIIASEPLTNEKDFTVIPPNYLIAADRNSICAKSIENLKKTSDSAQECEDCKNAASSGVTASVHAAAAAAGTHDAKAVEEKRNKGKLVNKHPAPVNHKKGKVADKAKRRKVTH